MRGPKLERISHDFRVTTGRDLGITARRALDPRIDDTGVATWFCPGGRAGTPVGALAHVDDGPGA